MRSVAFAALVALVLSASVPVLAQQGPAQGKPGVGPGYGPGPGRGMQQEVAPEQFPEFKAKVLAGIEERMKRLGEHRACVEKAQSHEEMRKCRPEPPMGGGGPMQRGPMPPKPPQKGAEAPK